MKDITHHHNDQAYEINVPQARYLAFTRLTTLFAPLDSATKRVRDRKLGI